MRQSRHIMVWPSLPVIGRLLGLALIQSSTFAQEEAKSSVFGHQVQQESSLIGILYDFKQTQNREPQKVKGAGILAEFIDNGWDEGLLNQFYRVTQPLYATQVFMPEMRADSAPRAFGVEDLVEPREWIVHYKGQVSAPQAGTYRFVGQADDWLAVAVNGETVLVGCHRGSPIPAKWKPTAEGPTASPMGGKLPTGDWFEVKQGEVIDLDILVGERPGGSFAAWLLIEEKGKEYEMAPGGKGALLPIFQVAPTKTEFKGSHPVHSFPEAAWKAHQ